MLSIIQSAALQGIDALPVEIEVNTGETGEPKLILVGLPDAAVKESQDRVFSALSNSGYSIPMTRTTINLAPGDLRKEGPIYDLPIALGLLASTEQLDSETLNPYLIAGELSLSGKIRPIRGGLAMALLLRKLEKEALLLPRKSAEEAALVEDITVYPVDTLDEIIRFLRGDITIEPLRPEHSPFRKPREELHPIDFSDIKGQQALRRAVEVAVAGGHNLLMIGPPGSGKSMVAQRIPTIMPSPTLTEFLEVLSIQSVAGVSTKDENRCFHRPFRSPHHTISDVGLLGGGNPPSPGEVSLAHNGVLFMDELPEFKRSALEVLRQPLEDGQVTISRSGGRITVPCSIMLVAAMNPCPCGYLGDTQKQSCRCGYNEIQRYRSRLSGPLLDRIDIHIDAPALQIKELQTIKLGEPSGTIKERISQARNAQLERFSETNVPCNARMNHSQIRKYCALTPDLSKMLQQAMESLDLSARAYDRILKVARTIADLGNSPEIENTHLLEAIQYRSLDRNLSH